MRYILVGYGRMGRAIELEAGRRGHEGVAIIDSADEARHLDQDPPSGVDLAFEFTLGEAAERNVVSLLRAGIPVVCGTTGWQPGPSLQQAVQESVAGVVIAPNFSVGMNLFFRVVAEASRLYGRLGLHDPYVHELHHRGKRDLPSGTARHLASILLRSAPELRTVQEGHSGEAIGKEAVHVTGTRAGAEPGEHTVGFDGEYDSITLRHRARGRTGFALGAVLAGEWLGRRRGLHSFEEALEDILARGAGAQGDRP